MRADASNRYLAHVYGTSDPGSRPPYLGRQSNCDSSEPDDRQAYRALEKGYLPASKAGRKWVTTARRIRSAFTGEGRQQ
jgi:hypothetical protein